MLRKQDDFPVAFSLRWRATRIAHCDQDADRAVAMAITAG
jgi:hypothetical protein